MTGEIRGRIIRIVNESTVVINLGRVDGVSKSTIFKILAGVESIIDPVTNNELGSLYIIKGRVKTEVLGERYTVATSYWSVREFQLLGSTMISLGSALKVDDGAVEPWDSDSSEPVKVGDTAIADVIEPDKQLPVVQDAGDTKTETDKENGEEIS